LITTDGDHAIWLAHREIEHPGLIERDDIPPDFVGVAGIEATDACGKVHLRACFANDFPVVSRLQQRHALGVVVQQACQAMEQGGTLEAICVTPRSLVCAARRRNG
jgi:hypothetical protein